MISDNLGIVVIGRNEGKRLINCLNSIKRLINTEIIYVDSGSSDGSAGAAKEYGAVVITLDPKAPFTAARARNEGFSSLIGRNPRIRFVQFVDGDCELVDGW